MFLVKAVYQSGYYSSGVILVLLGRASDMVGDEFKGGNPSLYRAATSPHVFELLTNFGAFSEPVVFFG